MHNSCLVVLRYYFNHLLQLNHLIFCNCTATISTIKNDWEVMATKQKDNTNLKREDVCYYIKKLYL